MKQKVLKSLYVMAANLAICITLFSCEKDVINIGHDYPSIEVDKYYLNFNSGDVAKDLRVSSQDDWSYKVDEDWAHVTRDGNNDKLSVQVDENRSKETRECILTIYVLDFPKNKREIKISQCTSLVTISCSEIELNFTAYEGAYNTISIQSNGEWKVINTPEWLRASVSSGKGNKTISFTTMSANKSSVDRSGNLVISTIDEKVEIPVKQYGEAMSNCQVTPKNITILSNGIAFDMDYSNASNVAHYYRGYMEASRVGIMTNQEIISALQHDFQRHLPADDEVAVFSELKPNTKYIIYTLAYDVEGKRGDLLSTEVMTRKEEVNGPCGWISNLTCTGSNWEWTITKSATCYSYWMMTTEDSAIALAPDVLQAWWLEDAVRRNKITEYFNGGDWQQKRQGNMIAVWTRGKTSDGIWAGKITWKGCEVSSSSTTRSVAATLNSVVMKKQNSGDDNSGIKLSPDQYQLYKIAE